MIIFVDGTTVETENVKIYEPFTEEEKEYLTESPTKEYEEVEE